ncbi:DUF1800 domain-containing protein [Cognatiyoonia sp. IB215182]|uniref:DUF1800 domain-containing protein n=1 Tax=Cognatiyoonia sp. IB215182 TaxID=3097353 RepID=UPI002A1268B0|nr:DUF1800 domain-containing protein [Cognatiyoonia sp. IB215182]MDX8351542.1 DUF1800 domain-containing protein [Cognatiyoonia sp. IB215182]
MRRLFAVFAVVSTGLYGGPTIAGPDAMTAEEARHLISRTGFGAAPHEITAFMGQSYEEGVDRILAGLQSQPAKPMPGWVDMWPYPQDLIWQLGQTKRELYFTNRWFEIEELSAWWMAEMIATPSPLTERLVLFWHDHFATSFDQTENSQWMANQNRFFRANAAGDFTDLAHGILRDPAMLDYLSNVENVVDAPNENLAREFLELFTLGENRGYDQADVRAAARALTGQTIAEHGAPVHAFYEEMHDGGVKTLFGQKGRFGATDLADLALAHPEFGPFVVEKLWLTFVSDQPDPAEVDRLVALWRTHDLELKPLLRGLLTSDAFWDPANRGRLVKSPVELIAGTVRSLGVPVDDARNLVWAAGDIGQTLFMPPNVGGWPQGVGWINDASASGRATMLTYLLEDVEDAADFAPTMMMATQQPVPLQASVGDLRVGQTFVTYVEEEDDTLGAEIILYDLGFQGESWRSLTLWLAHDRDEDFTGLYINISDCAPICLRSAPQSEDDPDWVMFETWGGFLNAHAPLHPDDAALIGAITQHLPALVQTTSAHAVWQPDADEDWMPPEIGGLIAASEALATKSANMLGRAETALALVPSHPSVLGLTGLDAVRDLDDINDYVEAREDAVGYAAIPQVVYPTTRDWIDALPGTIMESKRVSQALLAVPQQRQGTRHEMVVRDPEALLRHLILSPEYQVN